MHPKHAAIAAIMEKVKAAHAKRIGDKMPKPAPQEPEVPGVAAGAPMGTGGDDELLSKLKRASGC